MTHEAVLYMDFAPLADGLSEDMNRLSATGFIMASYETWA
jgi:hypothetical protein